MFPDEDDEPIASQKMKYQRNQQPKMAEKPQKKATKFVKSSIMKTDVDKLD